MGIIWPFLVLLLVTSASAAELSRFSVELEAGPVWQQSNDVEIPNDGTATRFSLQELIGSGPWPAARAYIVWNINERHSLRALAAPLSITETATPDAAIRFAGAGYEAGVPTEVTYKFNSWRLGYRYRFLERDDLQAWIGFTAKIRDAKVELRQGDTSSRDTDIGFVPLLHLAADWRFSPRWRVLFDFDGLAGGPGRAFDIGLKLARELGDGWRVGGGFRMIEGGADVSSVYNFAWLPSAVVSAAYRF